jgi:uncharacterized protein (DUF305 family)
MQWMSTPTLDGDADRGHGHGGVSSTSTSSDGSAAGSGVMPGMASEEDLERLRNSTGSDAETQFLTLMIAHHKGGVEMADAVLARSKNGVVTDLARAIVKAQVSEITVMESMLAARR